MRFKMQESQSYGMHLARGKRCCYHSNEPF